jgi:hypothetical protein
MIPILQATAWREFRGEPPKKGLNKTTHLAMIEAPSGKWHRCFVKGCPENWPTPITEAIGWLIAEALDLPRPEFAALVMVPLDKLRQHMPMDQHWLNYPAMLAFCASAVDGKTASHGWKWLAQLRAQRVYKRPEVARIAAFDCWVENQDRNTGNLIVKPDGECVPIDNEFILYSQLWAGRVPFSISQSSLLAESQKHLSSSGSIRFKVEMARHGKLHQAALTAVGPKLQHAFQTLIPDPAVANVVWGNIQQYLASRADPNWLPDQLGVIA